MPSRKTVYEMFGGRCAYCGESLDFENFHIDHIFPKSLGGKKDDDNVFPSCPDCNNYKCDLSIEEFREKISSPPQKNIHIRMMTKYYKQRSTPITFYFEEKGNGYIQSGSNGILDRSEDS